MRLLIRFIGFLFATGTILGLIGAAVIAVVLMHYSNDLPDHEALKQYEPPVMTRLHAADGSLIAEYAKERRLFLPIQATPDIVKQAFLSAEDKNFYRHSGIDPTGILRAVATNIENFGRNVRPQGASTITQQVAKNFLLTNETSIDRKIKEALLALRIEQALSKEQILELYLNEIYLGVGAYGVAAASLIYFDKAASELTIEEAAYLAALPKAPNNYHPFRETARAIERRNWVIDRMAENGYITAQQARAAKDKPLAVTPRLTGSHIYAAEYYAEEVRRTLYERYGERGLYEGGLSVRTALDPELQEMAKKALTKGLVAFDEARGWRGPVRHIELQPGADWGVQLADIPALNDVRPWRLAVVLDNSGNEAQIGLQPVRDATGALSPERVRGTIPLEGMKWAKWATGERRGRAINSADDVLDVGDVVYVEPLKEGENDGRYRLRQVPEISGGIVAMDPHTGRVRAMVGGFSYDQSQFNRASQALRQPGSSFKPLIYAAAMDNGYTPSSIVLDAPLELVQQGQETWRPQNYSGEFYGPQTLRFGIEKSRNVMTVRLAQDMGMPMISEYARRFGVYNDLPPFLSMALGAGETTLLRMVAGYSVFANGGKKVTPTLIDRIQDRHGRTVYQHDNRACNGCRASAWLGQQPPVLTDNREQVLDPLTAYQMTSMLEGVVLRGTATVLREVGKPIAGKTGTTNDYKDAWFVGFSPELAVGVYIGYDQPRNMGRSATGGTLAAPIVGDFMKMALADQPALPFRVPPGIKLIRINPTTGLRAQAGDQRVILEAFKPGTAPSDSYPVAGYVDQYGAPVQVSPEADRAVRTGTGGLY